MTTAKIQVLKNVQVPWAHDLYTELMTSAYPHVDNISNKKWIDLEPHLFWSDFRPYANILALRNMWRCGTPLLLRLQSEFMELAASVGYPRCHEYRAAGIMCCPDSVASHTDAPYRSMGLNWYLFPTYGHTVWSGEEMHKPQQGDLVLLDVDALHGSIHYTGDPIMFMSL